MIRRDQINRILVSRLRFMGDVILTIPVLVNLRKAFPNAHLSYLAEDPYHTLIENHPDVDRIFSLKRDRKGDQLRLISTLRKMRIDLAIDLLGNPRSAWLMFLSGAKTRIGGDFRYRKSLYTDRIRHKAVTQKAIEFHLQYLRPIGIPIEVFEPKILITEKEKQWAKEYLARNGFDRKQILIGIHPGATWPAKRWLPERFAALSNRLVFEMNANVLFTMGNGEEQIVRSVIQGCRFQAAKPEILTIRQLGALISLFDLFISNDCGPMHLAPAVGTKTIGIFGPGEPEIWFPYRSDRGHRFVHHEIDCSRCHQDFCINLDCMKAITVEDVFSAVNNSLREHQRK